MVTNINLSKTKKAAYLAALGDFKKRGLSQRKILIFHFAIII